MILRRYYHPTDDFTWTQAANLLQEIIRKLDTMPMSPKNQAEWERRRPLMRQVLACWPTMRWKKKSFRPSMQRSDCLE